MSVVAIGARLRLEAVVRNAVALMTSTVASAALGMLFWIVAARVYDTHEVGRASATISAIALVAGLSSLSLYSFVVRFLPEAGAATGRMLGFIYGLTGAVSVILGVGFCLLGFGNGFLSRSPESLVLFCTAVICIAYAAIQDSVLTALRRASWLPAVNISVNLAKVLLLPVAFGGVMISPMVIAWNVPVAVAVLVVSTLIFTKLGPARVRASRHREHVPTGREAASFMSGTILNGVVTTFTLYAPPIMVSAVLGAEHTAYFYVPWLIITVALSSSWNVAVSLIVEAASEPARMRRHLRQGIKLLLAVNVGGGMVLLLGAPFIMAVLGAEYVDGGAAVLRWCGLAFAVQAVKTMYNVIAILENQVWRNLTVDAVRAALFLVGAYIGLHAFGVVGAAIAYFASGAIVASAVVPATIRGLRRLVSRADAAVTEERRPDEKARVVAAVPQVYVNATTNQVEVMLLPESVIDWDRLGQFDTVMIDRVDDGQPRLLDDRTIPLRRFSPDSADVPTAIMRRAAPDERDQ